MIRVPRALASATGSGSGTTRGGSAATGSEVLVANGKSMMLMLATLARTSDIVTGVAEPGSD